MPGDRCAARSSSGNFAEDGHVGLEQDDAAKSARAIERPLRPFEQLNRVHVDQPQIGVRPTVAGPHVTEILADGRLRRSAKAGIRDTADKQLVPPGAEMGRGKAHRTCLDRLHAGHAQRRKFMAIDAGPLTREALRQRVALAGGDDNVLRLFGRQRGRRQRLVASGSGALDRSKLRRPREQQKGPRADFLKLELASFGQPNQGLFGTHIAPDGG